MQILTHHFSLVDSITFGLDSPGASITPTALSSAWRCSAKASASPAFSDRIGALKAEAAPDVCRFQARSGIIPGHFPVLVTISPAYPSFQDDPWSVQSASAKNHGATSLSDGMLLGAQNDVTDPRSDSRQRLIDCALDTSLRPGSKWGMLVFIAKAIQPLACGLVRILYG